MRMSCNGCRVLRKGCSENCSIRPCLQWIKTPESQANATVFLAKFYGRAGLMNLINSGPEHLRPAIFRSLLYEACGRIVNPIYGSVGLLWSGSWQLCQSAVEAVLKGAPIVQIPSDQAAVNSPNLPLIKAYDIRHVSKDEPNNNSNSGGGVGGGGGGATHPHHELHKVTRTRSRGFKRSSAASSSSSEAAAVAAAAATLASAKHHKTESNRGWNRREASHESSTTDEPQPQLSEPNSRTESMFSVETVEASLVSRAAEPKRSEDCQSDGGDEHESEVELELTLGFETSSRAHHHHHHHHRVGQVSERKSINGGGFDTCKMELGLDYPA